MASLTKAAAKAADGALRVTGAVTRSAQAQAKRAALDYKLGRAQRQLGALVYALRKNGAVNEALVARYVETIAQIEAEIAGLSGNAGRAPKVRPLCPVCGAAVPAEAPFCPSCGEKL